MRDCKLHNVSNTRCAVHSKRIVLNGYRVFTFSLIFVAAAGNGRGAGQGTLDKLKTSAKLEKDSPNPSKPRMIVKSPYKAKSEPLKEQPAPQRKQNDEDIKSAKTAQSSTSKNFEIPKSDDRKLETFQAEKKASSESELLKENPSQIIMKTDVTKDKDSLPAKQVKLAGEVQFEKNDDETQKKSSLKVSDPLPNFYISGSGVNSDLLRIQSDKTALSPPPQIVKNEETKETVMAKVETPKTGIGSQWPSALSTPSSSRQLLQSAFSSDYKNRQRGEVLPAILDGTGFNGKDLPIGGEDMFRLATLPSQFRPTDLVHIPPQYCFSRSDIYLRREAAAALVRMFNDAAKEGLTIKVFSGYRDYSHQQRLYTEAVAKNGENQKGVARPGKSEHQLGTTADVTNGAKHLLSRSFQDTPEGKWLGKNAAKYGWKMTVMAGDGRRSHSDEPWHIRYLGANVHNYKRGASSTYQIAAQPTPRPKKGLLGSLGGLLKK